MGPLSMNLVVECSTMIISIVDDDTCTMPDEYVVKKKVEYDVDRKGETERTLEDASDKVQAGAKAVANKIADPDRDLSTEYKKEKIKEKFD